MTLFRSLDKTSRIAIPLYLAVGVLLALFVNENWLPRLFQDDAFFYFSISRNFSDGLGSTFDGINLTNGYHPLWMFVLAAYHKIIPLHGMEGLRAVLILQTILNALTWLVMVHALRSLGVRPVLAGIAVVASIFLVGFSNYGMEAALWLLSFWLLVLTFRKVAAGGGGYVPAAICVVLAYGSRSDSLLFIGALAIVTTAAAYAQAKSAKALIACVSALWAPLIACAAVQAYVNLHVFGNVKTISSSLKTNPIGQQISLFSYTSERGLAAWMHKGVLILVFFAAVWGFVATLSKLKQLPAAQRLSAWFFLALNGYVLAFLSLIALTLREPPRTWYYTVSLTVVAGTFTWLASQREDFEKRLTTIALATAVVCLTSLLALYKLYGGSDRGNALATATWLRENTAPGDAAFVSDGSGIVNYFSERPVINGDGLVNNFEYQEFVKTRRLKQYLAQKNVKHVLANVNSPDRPLEGEIKVFVHNWRGPNIVYAKAEASNALGVFTSLGGFFGFAVFEIDDLRFE